MNMKIKKHNIIKSSLIKRIYSGIKSIKIYIDFFNDDNLYITRICKMFKWWTFDLYLNNFQKITIEYVNINMNYIRKKY